jgi:predicted nucleotidyltransferase
MTDAALIAYVRKTVLSLIALYRFGSRERDALRPDSDIDLAVLSREDVSVLRRFESA